MPIQSRDTKRSVAPRQANLDLIAAAVHRRKHGVTQAEPATVPGAIRDLPPWRPSVPTPSRRGGKS